MKIEGKVSINNEKFDINKIYKITIYPQGKRIYVNINEYSGKIKIDRIELKIRK